MPVKNTAARMIRVFRSIMGLRLVVFVFVKGFFHQLSAGFGYFLGSGIVSDLIEGIERHLYEDFGFEAFRSFASQRVVHD